MEKVLFFDVEYANPKNQSICQMGLVSEYFPSGESVFPEKNILINPEDGFDDWCISVHNITPKTIEHAPTFPEVWNYIKPYFVDSVIIGHDVAISDLSALARVCDRYKIDLPTLKFIDTYKLARYCIPSCDVNDYSLYTLCEYFNIDIDCNHDAFDDACAVTDLFKCLIETYNINIEQFITPFNFQNTKNFIAYIADPVLRKTMSEFYGVVQGFSLDGKIKPEEEAFIKQWKKDNADFENKEELKDIFDTLNTILEDNVITLSEMENLKCRVKDYYDIIQGSPITNSIQQLRGLLKGIITDNVISTEEGLKLKKWLYKNVHLTNNYPFDHVLGLFEEVLQDNVITKDESDSLIKIINSILEPVGSLKDQVTNICNKHICLSGNFAYGHKSDVEEVIITQGGFIDSNIKTSTDILIIGDYESQAYAHGNYGTKVKKAMEFNAKGYNITIVKEQEISCLK